MNIPVQSLYVHIPFCASKCFYCDFNSYVSSETVMETYTDALCKELQIIASEYPVQALKTIFFGGGTPTMLPPRMLEQILSTIHNLFVLDDQLEWTTEANPGSVDHDKLKVLLKYGVNRLSFGVQSFDDMMLHSIGRLHDRETVYRSFEAARSAGYTSMNLDLMFGLPGQTFELLADSLEQLASLDPEHVSVYGLKIEANTPFAKWFDQGHLQLPPEDEEVKMYEYVREFLKTHGYQQYEISNFAKPGHESKHNQVYWRNEPYLAAGAGAHGYINGMRYENVKKIDEYNNFLTEGNRPIADTDSISEIEQQEDTMMLGLRLREGVTYQRFYDRHQIHMNEVFGKVIQEYHKKGLLEVDEIGIRLQPSAYIVGNEVFAAFLQG